MNKIVDHSAYVDDSPKILQLLLVQLHTQIAKVLPDAKEIIAYDMLGFSMGDSIIAGYAAFSEQCGLYVDNSAITALADDIAAAELKAASPVSPFPPKSLSLSNVFATKTESPR